MKEFAQEHAIVLILGLFGFFILLFIIALIRGAMRQKQRKANLREWAFRSGYQYEEGPIPASDLAPFAQLASGEKTREASALNVMRGSRMTLFDLRRMTESHSGSHGNRTEYTTKYATYALFKMPEPLPHFSFSALTSSGPDTLQGRLLGATVALAQKAGSDFLQEAIQIENRPGFLLRGRERMLVKPFFAPDRIGFFDDKPGWSVDAHESWLLVSCDPAIYGHEWPRQALVDETRLDEFVAMAEAIKGHFAI
jgi:hypothetical protein